jgi:hypothetical protein
MLALRTFSLSAWTFYVTFSLLSNGFLCYDTIIHDRFTSLATFGYAFFGIQVLVHSFLYLFQKAFVLHDDLYLSWLMLQASGFSILAAPMFYLTWEWLALSPEK